MPSGHPKDPVAHAAVIAANREKRAAKKANTIKPAKRAYKRRKPTSPKKADILSESHIMVTKQGNIVNVLEDKVDALTWENELLKKCVEDAERRLITVIDLVSKTSL